MRQRRADLREDRRRHASTGPNRGCARTTWSPRSTATRIRGADGHWGDYPAIVPLMPSGADASAPHLTWNGDELRPGRGHVLRDRRAATAATTRRSAARSSSATRPRRCWIAAEALVEGLEAGLEAARAGNRACDIANALGGGAGESRDRARRALRLPDRAQLPARLGRAHHLAPRRRRNRAGAGHDLPLHAGALDGRLGARDHRDRS